MSKQLEDAAEGPVKRIGIDFADHNDLFEVGGEEMFRTIGEFVFSLKVGSWVLNVESFERNGERSNPTFNIRKINVQRAS